MNFKNYKLLKEEEEINKEGIKDALVWLKNKYGEELYTFKNMPNMKMDGTKIKTYDINVGEETYQLNLRKFDSNGDGEMDTVGFDVISATEEPETEEDEL